MTYEWGVERWNLTDDTHEGHYFATNEKGEPQPWDREEFVRFMHRFGFRLELTLDAAGARWTDDVRRTWHYGSKGTVHELAACGGDPRVCSALHEQDAQTGATNGLGAND